MKLLLTIALVTLLWSQCLSVPTPQEFSEQPEYKSEARDDSYEAPSRELEEVIFVGESNEDAPEVGPEYRASFLDKSWTDPVREVKAAEVVKRNA